MPLPENILTRIAGDNPGGSDLRYEAVYDRIKEFRREEDELPQGQWQRERKVADHNQVIKLAGETIATQSKDLQLAVWLTESLLRRDGYAGLLEGLTLCRNLVEQFWDHLYPVLEDGSAEYRAGPLELLGLKLDVPLKNVRLNGSGHSFYQFRDSRSILTEEEAKSKEQKAARALALKSGKIPPEAFDKAVDETPKDFYARAEELLDKNSVELEKLDAVCREKFGEAAPAFGKFRSALQEVRHTIHNLLEKKRRTEPDPVVVTPAAPPPVTEDTPEAGAGGESTQQSAPPPVKVTVQGPEEPPERKAAIAGIVAAAALFRQQDPGNPAPYLMLRGLRWGELRAAIQAHDPARFEAPPGELRRAIKQLALAGQWLGLIDAAESAMALPCTRAWLDLQRLVVEACTALGAKYDLISLAIQSELRALVRDLPQIFDLILVDDTPAANPETQVWLRRLSEEPQCASPKPGTRPFALDGDSPSGWQRQFVDALELASHAIRNGQEQKGFELLHSEIQRQRSGRARFEKRLNFVRLCVVAGKDALCQPAIDDLLAAIETHKLEDWEDRDMIAAALAVILNASKKIQNDAKEKQKMFERICRLNPVQALSLG